MLGKGDYIGILIISLTYSILLATMVTFFVLVCLVLGIMSYANYLAAFALMFSIVFLMTFVSIYLITRGTVK